MAFANRIHEKEVDEATRDGDLCDIVQAVRFLKEFVADSETCANRVETRAGETLDKTSELCLLLEELTQTFDEERVQVANLVDVELP